MLKCGPNVSHFGLRYVFRSVVDLTHAIPASTYMREVVYNALQGLGMLGGTLEDFCGELYVFCLVLLFSPNVF